MDISIHTLRMEGDGALTRAELYDGLFQSTPSAWRVTSLEQRLPRNSSISIHTLRMEGDLSASAFFDLSVISIHTLRMEGDPNHLTAWKIY